MRWTAPVLLLALVLASAADCDTEGSGGHTERRPGAGAAQPPAPPAPVANQPGPQADPGACNARGPRTLQVQAHWQSETSRGPDRVLWWKNGVSTPATNLRTTREGRVYGGEWSTLIDVVCGDAISVEIAGSPSMTQAICAVIDLGQDAVNQGKRDCRASYQVP